jgi:hypothetical protein
MIAPPPTGSALNAALNGLDLPSAAVAYEVVLKDLHARLGANPSGEMRATVEQALVALDAVSKMPAPASAMHGAGSAAAEPPKPWSSADIEDEVAREQLDP